MIENGTHARHTISSKSDMVNMLQYYKYIIHSHRYNRNDSGVIDVRDVDMSCHCSGHYSTVLQFIHFFFTLRFDFILYVRNSCCAYHFHQKYGPLNGEILSNSIAPWHIHIQPHVSTVV